MATTVKLNLIWDPTIGGVQKNNSNALPPMMMATITNFKNYFRKISGTSGSNVIIMVLGRHPFTSALNRMGNSPKIFLFESVGIKLKWIGP